MKANQISDALNELDDALIEETAAVRGGGRKKIRRWVMWAAACLAVAVCVGVANHLSGPNTADLPVLDISQYQGANGFGFEGYMAYDVSELLNGNPWTERDALKTMPVYRNPVTYDRAGAPVSGTSLDAMRARVLEVAGRLGVEVQPQDNAPSEEELAAVREKYGEIPEGYFPPAEVTAEGVGVRISVGADLAVEIDFDPAIDLPEDYNFHFLAPYQDMEKVANYLKELYGGLLDMDKPQVDATGGDYTFSGEQTYGIMAYDAAGSKTDRILNYNFNTATFHCNDEGKLWIVRLNRPDLSQKVGDYPIITPKQAEELLCAGNYITTAPEEMPGEEYVAKVELIYRTGRWDEYFMPYYRFYVELPDMEHDGGLKTFGAYYVPAVAGEFLTGMPVWDGRFN